MCEEQRPRTPPDTLILRSSPAQMEQPTWSLSPQERDATIDRIANNISTIAFFKGLHISDDAAKAAAAAAEKKAYTAAQVAARTTTGNRPAAETTSAYARWVAWLLAAVTAGLQAVGHYQHSGCIAVQAISGYGSSHCAGTAGGNLCATIVACWTSMDPVIVRHAGSWVNWCWLL